MKARRSLQSPSLHCSRPPRQRPSHPRGPAHARAKLPQVLSLPVRFLQLGALGWLHKAFSGRRGRGAKLQRGGRGRGSAPGFVGVGAGGSQRAGGSSGASRSSPLLSSRFCGPEGLPAHHRGSVCVGASGAGSAGSLDSGDGSSAGAGEDS